MLLRQVPPHRSEAYLDFIRLRPCHVTGQEVDVVAHHVRCLGGGGMGMKPTDYFCVPLVNSEHDRLHNMGEKSYWASHDIVPEEAILMHLLCFVAGYYRGPAVITAVIEMIESLKKG